MILLVLLLFGLSSTWHIEKADTESISYNLESENVYRVERKDFPSVLAKLGVVADSPVCNEIRVSHSTFAFRYVFDEEKDSVFVEKELTAWKFPQDARVWYFERPNHWKLKSYAGEWKSCLVKDFHRISPEEPLQGFPLIFDFGNDRYALLTEVALKEYSGMRIRPESDGVMVADFTEKKGFSAGNVSPWRVLFFADGLDELVNQQAVANLSELPDSSLYSDMSYVIPGKCAWRWFSKGTGTPAQERKIIRQAARLKFRYSLIDDGWNRWEDSWTEMKKLSDYARRKGVGLFFWKHSAEIIDSSDDYAEMRHWLDSVKMCGVAGVKVDFMNSEAENVVDFETRLDEEAAARRLLVIFHGCHKPTGEQFTYPNEVSREAIRGLEVNKLTEGMLPASHNAALPFTRFVTGYGDYTPLTFTVPGETTFAHQLATLICFTSPVQVIAEDPGLLLHNRIARGAREFIEKVPTVWDRTVVMPGSRIGETAVIARRNGHDWYIGVLNGENREKVISLDLAGLDIPHSEDREMIVISDDSVAEKVIIPMKGHRPVQLERCPSVPFKKCTYREIPEKMDIVLAPCGGAVIYFE